MLKNSIFIILTLFINFDSASEEIENIIKKNDSFFISILAKDLKNGKKIFSYNSSKSMIPASVVKSFTTYASLIYLGPNFKFKTSISKDQNNNIYIKFYGDPTLSRENLKNLIDQLPQEKYRNIYIDTEYLDDQYFGDGWSIEDTKFCFSAPSSTVVVDKNCFRGLLKPGNKLGDYASLILSDNIEFENNIITKEDPNCEAELKAKEGNYYLFSGCIDINSQPLKLNVAYQDPKLMIEKTVKEFSSKIDFSGEIIFKTSNPDTYIIAEHYSPPLSQIIKVIQKDSDNLIANILLKALGAEYFSKQGSFKLGIKALYQILSSEINLSTESSRLVDGSGSSRYNLLTSEQIVSLFLKAYSNKYFYNSLATSSLDGTIKEFLKNHPHLSLKAKTGSMSNIYNIAGYLNNKIAFSIMINGHILKNKETAQLLESIIDKLTMIKY